MVDNRSQSVDYLNLKKKAEFLSNSLLITGPPRAVWQFSLIANPFVDTDLKNSLVSFLSKIEPDIESPNYHGVMNGPFNMLSLEQDILGARFFAEKNGIVVVCRNLFVKRVLKRHFNRCRIIVKQSVRLGLVARDIMPSDNHVIYHKFVRLIRAQFKDLIAKKHLNAIWVNPIAYRVKGVPTLLPRVVLEWKTGYTGPPTRTQSPLVSLLLHPGIKRRSGEVGFRANPRGFTVQLETRLEIFTRKMEQKEWGFLISASASRALEEAELVYSQQTVRPSKTRLDSFLRFPSLKPKQFEFEKRVTVSKPPPSSQEEPLYTPPVDSTEPPSLTPPPPSSAPPNLNGTEPSGEVSSGSLISSPGVGEMGTPSPPSPAWPDSVTYQLSPTLNSSSWPTLSEVVTKSPPSSTTTLAPPPLQPGNTETYIDSVLPVQNAKICFVSELTRVNECSLTPPRASPQSGSLEGCLQQSVQTPTVRKPLKKDIHGESSVAPRSSARIRKKKLLIAESCQKGTIDFYFKKKM